MRCFVIIFIILGLSTELRALWSPPQELSDVQGAARIGVSEGGQAVIVWPNNGAIAAVHRGSATASWSGVHVLADKGLFPIVSREGMVLWQQGEGAGARVYASLCTAQGWRSFGAISEGGGFDPRVAAMGSSVVAAWRAQRVNSQLTSRLFVNGQWTPPLDFFDFEAHQGHNVAVDESGHAALVWHEREGAFTRIMAATFADGLWSDARALSPPNKNGSNPSVSIDPKGNAIVVWATPQGIQSVTYSFIGHSWSNVYDLSSLPPAHPPICASAASRTVALWERCEGSTCYIESAMCIEGVWSAPQVLAEGNVREARLAMNRSGDVVALWLRLQGTHSTLVAIARAVNDVWTDPVVLSSSLQTVSNPDVGIDGRGQALVVFSSGKALYLSSGTDLYAISPPLPPCAVQARQIRIKKELINEIVWQPSPSANIAFYHIYRSGTLIATIMATAPSLYQDRHQKTKSKDISYALTAVDHKGRESKSVMVSIPTKG